MLKRRRLTSPEALATLATTRQIPRLFKVDIAQALQLAADVNLYAWNAYFLHCARTLSHPLLTLDTSMRQVADQQKTD
jgi:predicted nucleic acid-binding protein